MKICIDCRFWGLENTGIGRYTMRLAGELTKLDKNNEYFLLMKKDTLKAITYKLKAKNYHLIEVEAQPYTFQEQLKLAKLLHELKPDVYHAVDINVPVLMPYVSRKTKLVVTIHDLTRQIEAGATTLFKPVYWLKRVILNQWVTKQAIQTAKAIIVPSEYVKKQVLEHYANKHPVLRASATPGVTERVHVTYEAPEAVYSKRAKREKSRKTTNQLLKSYQLKANSYLVYTGNAYPHKNLERLVEAVRLGVRSSEIQKFRTGNSKLETRNLNLVIVCGRNIFREKIEKLVKQKGMEDYVKFLGFVEDDVLRELYRKSLAFITPSLHEGFGLPGLEAMAAGTLVLSSKASCLPEIYGDAAFYFEPMNPRYIAQAIEQAARLGPNARKKQIEYGKAYAKQFSWERLGRETLEIYKLIV